MGAMDNTWLQVLFTILGGALSAGTGMLLERYRNWVAADLTRSQLGRELEALIEQIQAVLNCWEVKGEVAEERGRLRDLVGLVRNSYVSDPTRFVVPKSAEGGKHLFDLFLALEGLPGWIDTWEGTPIEKTAIEKAHGYALAAKGAIR